MERRLYFIVGDVLANASTGALVAVACTSTVADAVPMALAMPIGMVVGGIMAMLLAVALTVAFGAFEVMLPVMTTGMLVGMVALMRVVPPGAVAVSGAAAGLVVLIATYLLDAHIQARSNTWTP